MRQLKGKIETRKSQRTAERAEVQLCPVLLKATLLASDQAWIHVSASLPVSGSGLQRSMIDPRLRRDAMRLI